MDLLPNTEPSAPPAPIAIYTEDFAFVVGQKYQTISSGEEETKCVAINVTPEGFYVDFENGGSILLVFRRVISVEFPPKQ